MRGGRTGLHWFENVPVSGAGTHDTGAMNGAVLHELRHRCCQIVRTDTHCAVHCLQGSWDFNRRKKVHSVFRPHLIAIAFRAINPTWIRYQSIMSDGSTIGKNVTEACHWSMSLYAENELQTSKSIFIGQI